MCVYNGGVKEKEGEKVYSIVARDLCLFLDPSSSFYSDGSRHVLLSYWKKCYFLIIFYKRCVFTMEE